MGMDTIELVMELEDQFGIDIPDTEAEAMVTVGQTADYIAFVLQRRLGGVRPNGVCSTQRTFYGLRRALVQEMGVPREQVRPNREIGSLITDRERRRAWPDFAMKHGLIAPRYGLRTAVRFPRPTQTVGSLAREIMRRVDAAYLMDDGTLDTDAIYQKVRSIVAEQAGIPIEKIERSTRYVQDLGLT